MNQALVEKCREGQEDLHCIFIDLEKDDDRVPRQEVWNCLSLKKVEEKYIRIIMIRIDIYSNIYRPQLRVKMLAVKVASWY